MENGEDKKKKKTVNNSIKPQFRPFQSTDKTLVLSPSPYTMSTSFNEENWSRLSLKLANDPENFQSWESLVDYASKTISKTSSATQLETFRATYTQFLSKYPLLEQYWTNYALLEFKLGFTDNALAIFSQSLAIIPNSNIIWVHYLNLLEEIELDYENLVLYYQQAEELIGYHYHSYEFWKSFIRLEQTFNGKSIYYYNLLRKVIQIPIFNYSYFFNILLQEIEDLDKDSLSKLVDETDLIKKYKLDVRTTDFKNFDFHDVKAKLKKFFTEVYITTQFKTFEVYQFEKKITLEYYVPGVLKSYQEVTNWEQYTSFAELNGTKKQIEHLYGRCLISMASYPNFWVNYADYFINQGRFQDAANLLYRSLLFLSNENIISIHLKLIRLEIRLKNYLKARDIIVVSLESYSESLPLLLELLNLEYLLNFRNERKFLNFFSTLINGKSDHVASFLLHHLNGFKQLKLETGYLEGLNSRGQFNNNVRFWLIILKASLIELPKDEVKATYKKALKHTSNDEKLLLWHDKYLSYDVGADELVDDFNLSSLLVFK